MKALRTQGRKDVIEAGSLLVPATRDPELYGITAKRSFVQDLIPSKPEGTNEVTYLRQTVRTNNAAVVADSAMKPTSTYTLAEVTGKMKTIGHLSEYVLNRMLRDDAGLMGWLTSELKLGYDLAVEADAVSTIVNAASILTQTFSTDAFTSIRKGLTQLQTKFVSPDVLIVNFTDAEAFDLTQDGIERFFFGGPQASGITSSTIWNARVLATDAIPAGHVILMSAAEATRRYVREEMVVDVDTQSHFDTNETRMRLEGRSFVAVVRPFAICRIALS